MCVWRFPELNSPRYLWLEPPNSLLAQPNSAPSADAQRLLRAAVANDGEVIFQEGFGLQIRGEEFTDETHRSVAR